MNVLLVALAMLFGVFLAMQPAVNSAMAEQLTSPFMAAMVSLIISLMMVFVIWASVGKFSGQWSNIPKLPIWVLLGGAAGALFVAGGILVAPKIGVLTFLIAVIAGQMLGAALVDGFGAFGMTVRSLSFNRLLGIGLVICGVIVAQINNSTS